jgi:hypothetical protein
MRSLRFVSVVSLTVVALGSVALALKPQPLLSNGPIESPTAL